MRKGFSDMSDFSTRFKNLLLKRGVSQLELSRLLGVSPSSVSMYICGKREPSLSLLSRICDCLSVAPDELLGRTEPSDSALKLALFGTDALPGEALDMVRDYAVFVASKYEGR